MRWTDISLAEDSVFKKFMSDGVSIRDSVIISDSISPLHVYLSLKDIFGEPNSINFDDDKTQWMFALQSKDAYFEIYDWKKYIFHIAVYKINMNIDADEIGVKLLNLIKEKAKHQTKTINNKVIGAKELVIENPYLIYKKTADSMLSIAKELNNTNTFGNDLFNINNYDRIADLCRTSFLMYLSSVEAFINLIYEIYLKKDLRDKRIYSRIYREQIDLKIQLAPIYCNCFKNDILDSDNDKFKRYHSLVNLRNDFVHANVTVNMKTPVIDEDGFKFLVTPNSTSKIGIPNNFSELEIQHIESTKDITQDLINHVIESMTPEYQIQIIKLIERNHIKL